MEKRVYETFYKLKELTVQNMIETEPSCDLQEARVIKYKITIEEVEEPIGVIQERIKNLLNTVDIARIRVLKEAGKKYGLELGWKKIPKNQ